MKHVQAKHYREGRLGEIRVIVAHDMEAPEGPLTAENVAAYFARGERVASAHVNVDNNSAVRSVADADTAYAAPGCNHDGLHLEIAGYARQTRAQWLDAYSRAALAQGAKVCATWAKKYGIPVRKLTVAELKAGKRGFVGHVDVSAAYRRTDHGDPGKDFPWDFFLDLVRAEMGAPPAKPRLLRLVSPLMSGADVKAVQTALNAHGAELAIDGRYGARTAAEVRAFQRTHKLDSDGVVGPATRKALGL